MNNRQLRNNLTDTPRLVEIDHAFLRGIWARGDSLVLEPGVKYVARERVEIAAPCFWLGRPNDCDITPEFVRGYLREEGGRYFFRERTDRYFSGEITRELWNRKYAGKQIGISINAKGYHCLHVARKTIMLHSLVWMLHYGEWPKHSIDHINGNRLDNRIVNLRDVPQTINNHNSFHKCNTTGVRGVSWLPKDKLWRARFRLHKFTHLDKCFKSFDDAVAARRTFEEKFGIIVREAA